MSTDNAPSNRVEKIVRTDWTDFDHPETAVVERVSDETGLEVTDLPILQTVVDVDALNALLSRGNGAEPVRITFQYAGLEVTVRSDRSMQLHVPAED